MTDDSWLTRWIVAIVSHQKSHLDVSGRHCVLSLWSVRMRRIFRRKTYRDPWSVFGLSEVGSCGGIDEFGSPRPNIGQQSQLTMHQLSSPDQRHPIAFIIGESPSYISGRAIHRGYSANMRCHNGLPSVALSPRESHRTATLSVVEFHHVLS